MPAIFLPPGKHKRLLRKRRESGLDRYDEVWDGVYVMSPLANFEHQVLGTRLASAIIQALPSHLNQRISAGANASDRSEGWTKNYRVPDVVVFLPDNPAEIFETHACGGPDFAVEVISKGDRSREKFEFYAKVGVRELLLVDRYPWRLELYRNLGKKFVPAGSCGLGDSKPVVSDVLPVSFRLVDSDERPRIEVTQNADGRTWTC